MIPVPWFAFTASLSNIVETCVHVLLGQTALYPDSNKQPLKIAIHTAPRISVTRQWQQTQRQRDRDVEVKPPEKSPKLEVDSMRGSI